MKIPEKSLIAPILEQYKNGEISLNDAEREVADLFAHDLVVPKGYEIKELYKILLSDGEEKMRELAKVNMSFSANFLLGFPNRNEKIKL